MMAHPGWLQLLHARPADMHLSVKRNKGKERAALPSWRQASLDISSWLALFLPSSFLLWLRANMMCTFAILCRDIRVLLSWQAPKAAAGAGAEVGAGIGAGPGAVPSSGSGASAQLAAASSSSAAHVAPIDAAKSGGTVHVQVDLPKSMVQGGAAPTALQLSP